jgi:hypothetical protein
LTALIVNNVQFVKLNQSSVPVTSHCSRADVRCSAPNCTGLFFLEMSAECQAIDAPPSISAKEYFPMQTDLKREQTRIKISSDTKIVVGDATLCSRVLTEALQSGLAPR